MQRILFLINPISGTSTKESLLQLIQQVMESAHIDYNIKHTTADGNYSFLEQELGGFTHITIAGGDGTINNVIAALRHLGKPFGIIPSGSGNGLALSAGIATNKAKALQTLIHGKPQPTDAFSVNGRFACMLCGLGLDAVVAHQFATAGKRGLTTYIQKVISSFWAAKPYRFVLEQDSQSLQVEAYFISIANSNQFGNQFTIAPKASLNDGLLDVVVMLHQSKWSVLLQTLLQVSGFIKVQSIEQISAEASVLYFQTDRLRIHNPGGAPLHVDGDPAQSASVIDVAILPGAFQLIYPS